MKIKNISPLIFLATLLCVSPLILHSMNHNDMEEEERNHQEREQEIPDEQQNINEQDEEEEISEFELFFGREPQTEEEHAAAETMEEYYGF